MARDTSKIPEYYLCCIIDIEVGIGLEFAPSVRDHFRHMWE